MEKLLRQWEDNIKIDDWEECCEDVNQDWANSGQD
jgi:hypothetical protein